MNPRARHHENLRAELTTLGLHPRSDVLERCLEYWELLLGANRRLNLVSESSLEQGPVRHIGDALAALVHWVPPMPGRLLDVGSGGGLPGIPLALAVEDLEVTLLEPRERKADWLARIVRGLKTADRVTVRTGRIEEQSREWVGRFESLTARAVAPPERLLAWCLPRMRPGQRLLVWHSDAQKAPIYDIIRSHTATIPCEIQETFTYHFRSISFSSNISSIARTR